mmetsp:Transcript_15332/g.32259  ORF Transcript_15332/g.32259 Transcript_15332/m.32259 type:complete len:141 (-) Transcript_15332:326-748(-)
MTLKRPKEFLDMRPPGSGAPRLFGCWALPKKTWKSKLRKCWDRWEWLEGGVVLLYWLNQLGQPFRLFLLLLRLGMTSQTESEIEVLRNQVQTSSTEIESLKARIQELEAEVSGSKGRKRSKSDFPATSMLTADELRVSNL